MGGPHRRLLRSRTTNQVVHSIALFLIANGLLHDYNVAKFLNNPDFGDTLRLRALVREFPKIQTTGTARPPLTENHADNAEDEP
jgi:hypothetical protein